MQQQRSSVGDGGSGSAVAVASDWSGRVYLFEQTVAGDDNDDSERSGSRGRCQLVSFWPNADAVYAESPLQTPAMAAKLRIEGGIDLNDLCIDSMHLSAAGRFACFCGRQLLRESTASDTNHTKLRSDNLPSIGSSVVAVVPVKDKGRRHHVAAAPVAADLYETVGVLQAQWHPLSDFHLVILSVDGFLRIYDVSSAASRNDPVLELSLFALVNEDDGRDSSSIREDKHLFSPTSFCFPHTPQTSAESWDVLSIYVLSRDGRVYVLCPVAFPGLIISRAMHNSLLRVANDNATSLKGDGSIARTWLLGSFIGEEENSRMLTYCNFPDVEIFPRIQGPLDVSMRLSLLESVDNNFGAATAFSYVQINVDDEDYESNSSTANSVGGHLCVLAVGTARGYLTLYVVDGSTRLSFTSNTGRNLEDSADDHPKPLASLIEVDAVQITDEDGGCDEGNFAILEITPCPRYREVLLVRSRKRVYCVVMKWLQALLKGFASMDGSSSREDAHMEAKLPVASVHSLTGGGRGWCILPLKLTNLSREHWLADAVALSLQEDSRLATCILQDEILSEITRFKSRVGGSGNDNASESTSHRRLKLKLFDSNSSRLKDVKAASDSKIEQELPAPLDISFNTWSGLSKRELLKSLREQVVGFSEKVHIEVETRVAAYIETNEKLHDQLSDIKAKVQKTCGLYTEMAAQIETIEQENINLLRRRSEILDMLVEYQKVRGLTDTEIKAFEQLNKIEQSIPELFVQVEHLRGRSKVLERRLMRSYVSKSAVPTRRDPVDQSLEQKVFQTAKELQNIIELCSTKLEALTTNQ